ncbi:hypothetical protein VTN77DRAFT_9611 [Rasamsonia byssochlamydoides]|uniref:uncharacterized protein n=1 Tax=Rasamsonia byssochlamydoides TaxID=89139 RepID=UPI0037447ED0
MSSLRTMTAAVGHRPPDPGINIDKPLDDLVGGVKTDPDHHGATPRDNDDSNGAMYTEQQDLPSQLKAEPSPDNENIVVPGSNGDVAVSDGGQKDEPDADPASGKPTDEDEQKRQEREKQSAASSLLAQLLGNAPPPASSAADNVPPTPLPEPLTDASTDPGAAADELSTNEPDRITAADPVVTQDESLSKLENQESTGNGQESHGSPVDPSMGQQTEEASATRIPDIVSGVMEDPLSKTSHDGLFPTFDPEAAPKDAVEALQQHDLLNSAYLGQGMDLSGLPDIPGYSNSNSYNEPVTSIAGSEPRIQAFAKLEFDDGHFYVNTYSFILGRDVRAARAAYQRELQARQAMGRSSKNKSSSGGYTSHTPNRVKREGSAIMGSVVSDRGGIMGFDPDIPPHLPPQLSRKSSNSSHAESGQALHATPAQLQANHTDYNALAMQSLYEGNGDAKPVDTLALLPSPDACPTIPIHPPATADGSAAGHKGISRKHVKIAYNFDKNLFEMEVIGRNGAFIGADWLAPGQIRPLHSGDYIQIGGVRIRFLLPDVPIGETGADRVDDSYMEEDENALAGTAAVSDAPANNNNNNNNSNNTDGVEVSGTDGADNAEKPNKVTKIVLKTKEPDPSQPQPSIEGNPETPQPPRRRGPGRPPKDGIMSKRERAEIAREQKLAAKREANGGVTPPPSNRSKPPKPRKEDSTEDASKQEKRKYTKRKQPDGTMVDIPIQSIEGGELPPDQLQESYSKPPPPKKRKPSRSPSPDYPPESAYTPEDLAKPPYNYAVLIFDALTESRTPMTLKQIYRALKLKYPYFRFKCETEGWTSSVRHNLNGNSHLFMHAERDGKGWSWQLRPGASVEKEKKRRPSPPPPPSHVPPHSAPGAAPALPHQQQHYMPPPSHPYPGPSGVPNHPQNQQFQFQSMPPNPYNGPAPQHSSPYPPTSTPQTQVSLPGPLRTTHLPAAFLQPGPATYTSPYPCELPPEIVQLQQQEQQQQQQQLQQQQQRPLEQPRQAESAPTQQQQGLQQHPSPYVPQNPSQFPNTTHLAPPPPVPPSQFPQSQPSQAQPPQYPNSMQPNPAPPDQSAMQDDDDRESTMSFTERANKAIDDFEAVLMEDYEDKDYIREVLKSARARALGHAEESSFPGGEPKDEAVILDALRNLIGSLKGE